MTGEPDPDDVSMQMDHIDHCVDMIRQNIMCSSDITPLPFEWDKKAKMSKVVGTVLRTCRDFDAMRAWALENRVRDWNPHVQVFDPLGNKEYK